MAVRSLRADAQGLGDGLACFIAAMTIWIVPVGIAAIGSREPFWH
jgi:hypothetical protein